MTDQSGILATDVFVCPRCHGDLTWAQRSVVCGCGWRGEVEGGIPRFVVDDGRHESFALQWSLFADVQLDSRNGTSLSRDRLVDQSGLDGVSWRGRRVLEVGAGAGRFTEVLLEFGACVVSLDYSRAIEACVRNNRSAHQEGRLVAGQADVFALPVRPESFEVVLCYGVLQHTGNPRRALAALWRCVSPGGILLVDHYQLSLTRTQPIKYLVRPVTKRWDPVRTLRAAESTVDRLAGIEGRLIRSSYRLGRPGRLLRYIVHRAPNSTYPFELELHEGLDPTRARRWSILDTVDQWAPAYDRPWTFRKWTREVERLPQAAVERAFTSGQGNVAVVRKQLTSEDARGPD